MSGAIAEQHPAQATAPAGALSGRTATDDTPVGIWPRPFPKWALALLVLMWAGWMGFLAVMAFSRH